MVYHYCCLWLSPQLQWPGSLAKTSLFHINVPQGHLLHHLVVGDPLQPLRKAISPVLLVHDLFLQLRLRLLQPLLQLCELQGLWDGLGLVVAVEVEELQVQTVGGSQEHSDDVVEESILQEVLGLVFVEHLHDRPHHLPDLVVDETLPVDLEPHPLLVLLVQLAGHRDEEPLGGGVFGFDAGAVVVVVPGTDEVGTQPVDLLEEVVGVLALLVEEVDGAEIAVVPGLHVLPHQEFGLVHLLHAVDAELGQHLLDVGSHLDLIDLGLFLRGCNDELLGDGEDARDAVEESMHSLVSPGCPRPFVVVDQFNEGSRLQEAFSKELLDELVLNGPDERVLLELDPRVVGTLVAEEQGHPPLQNPVRLLHASTPTIILGSSMEYLESLASFDIDLKYLVLLFNFVTIASLLIYRKLHPPPKPERHNILILTAHPDDEAMFFQPTIKNLRDNQTIHLLCLSANEAREKELRQACERLKISHVQCFNHENLKDGMKEKWDQQLIQETVLRYIKEHHIKALITFDSYGISGHPNHKAINSSLKARVVKEKSETTIKFYQLTSTNLLRKYSSILDFPLSLLAPFMFVDLNIVSQYLTLSQHKSQLVWYRRLFILLSRYSILNTYEHPLWMGVEV